MLYHGSKEKFDVIKRHQAWGPPGTPPEENLNVIYLTPNFAFAMHCASAPEGNNEVNHNEKTVRFENLGKFNPEEKGYIYVVDPSRIPEGKMKFIDPWQVAVDLDEITPDKVETHKAGELLQHYSII